MCANVCLRTGSMSAPANYVHEEAIWRQRLEEETRGASEWWNNWGFLANKPQPAPRGFSNRVAKYSFGGNQWTVSSVRVADNSQEGIDAAESEMAARKRLSSLKYSTMVPNLTKPCEARGAYTGMKLVDSDTGAPLGRSQVHWDTIYMPKHMC